MGQLRRRYLALLRLRSFVTLHLEDFYAALPYEIRLQARIFLVCLLPGTRESSQADEKAPRGGFTPPSVFEFIGDMAG